MQRTGSNETALVSKIPYKPVSILSNEFCGEQAFSYLLSKGEFNYKAPRDIPISPAQYF